MRAAIRQRLQPMLTESATQLFRSYGMAIVSGKDPRVSLHDLSEGAMLSFIQLVGDMTGALLLAVTPGLLWQTFPVGVANPGDEVLSAWGCELCSQLLGQLKQRVRIYGVRLLGTTPMALLEPGLTADDGEFGPLPIFFRCGQEAVYVQLDATVAAGVDLCVEKQHEDDEHQAGESDVILF